MVLSELDFSSILHSLQCSEHKKGLKGYDALPLLYNLIVMQLKKIKNIVKLVDRLKSDPVFIYNC